MFTVTSQTVLCRVPKHPYRGRGAGIHLDNRKRAHMHARVCNKRLLAVVPQCGGIATSRVPNFWHSRCSILNTCTLPVLERIQLVGTRCLSGADSCMSKITNAPAELIAADYANSSVAINFPVPEYQCGVLFGTDPYVDGVTRAGSVPLLKYRTVQ